MFARVRESIALLCTLLAGACSDAGGPATGTGDGRRPPAVLNETAWPMHPVASHFRGANALGAGDVNRDGFTDYVTNYEFDQRYVIAFHPGPDGNVRQEWPTVTAFVPEPLTCSDGINPENASLGDFDGDGNLDIVAAQGWSELVFWDGSQPGVRLIWGPPPDQARDPAAWSDAGRIPESIDRGHFLYVVPRDINGDGALDIVAGGRVHGGNGRKGGVLWIEAPPDPAERRDLSRWIIHDIDPEQFSAHGMVFTDVDMDGDEDIVLANADWDTPEDRECVVWYENPGTGSPAQEAVWPQHVIYQGSEFAAKPQLAVADLDGDGREDLLTQVEQAIYYFRKTGTAPVAWETVVIPKDPVARWPGRPVRVADINRDGKPDILGMLMHVDGDLPAEKAAGFWMEYGDGGPRAGNWTTHVIKWGAGRTMLLPIFGEKWDQMNILDVDRDGDLDIVANCEEWWEDELEFRFYCSPKVAPDSVAVVWFENRLCEAPFVFRERSGLCVMEAEHHTDLRDGTWIVRARYGGHAGTGYVQDPNALDPGAPDWNDTLGLEYAVELDGGSYALWVRRWAPEQWGLLLGRSESNSARVGVDDLEIGDLLDNVTGEYGAWTWVQAQAPLDLTRGRHTVHLRIREGGYAVDRILMASVPGYVPSGAGPAETPLGD